MPTKKELTDAYAAALLDHSENTPFVLFRDPNETGKTVKGRLTQHNDNFYVKTPTQFYLIQGSTKVRETFEKDQNVEINFTPDQTTLNGTTVQATAIQ